MTSQTDATPTVSTNAVRSEADALVQASASAFGDGSAGFASSWDGGRHRHGKVRRGRASALRAYSPRSLPKSGQLLDRRILYCESAQVEIGRDGRALGL